MSRRAALLGGVVLLAAGLAVAAVFALRGDEQTAHAPPPAPPAKLERVRDLAARVSLGQAVALRSKPGGGRVLARIGRRTEFGSPQTLAVAFRRGDWVAVRSPALGNDEVGWVNTKATRLRLLRRPLSLEVDLSRRELTVHERAGEIKSFTVEIGAPETPTPPGDFYVTDKLAGADFGPAFGCCILALSGRQPNLPRGWSGGDRLAIHGSPGPVRAVAISNGCLHADESDLRYLMRTVPLGTRVVVHL